MTTRKTGGMHYPYKGFLLAEPQGSRIVLTTAFCAPLPIRLAVGCSLLRLFESHAQLGVSVCFFVSISTRLLLLHTFFDFYS